MTISQSHAQRIRERKSIINLDVNSQIKSYQRQLVVLSFTKDNVTEEYFNILKKIHFLRQGLLKGELRSFD